jgi:hypothetical protein
MELKKPIYPKQKKVNFKFEEYERYNELKLKGFFTEKFADYVRSSFYNRFNKDKLNITRSKNE